MDAQLEQLSPIKQNSIMKEEKKNQNTVITTFPTNFMQKKQNRKRINMMKCREFNDYYGYETQKKFSNKAQTILDVIYETLYDFKHGNQTDIFDQNQELNFFLEKRSQTKTIEKDLALQTLEEQLKKNEEIKEKEKNNKTYFMKSKYFEQCSKQNQEITQIEKSYYNEIKKSSTQEQKQSQFSERQMRERRNKIIQEMKQTYSKFHTKYNPITLNAIQEVSDLAQSENKTNVTLNNLKKKNKEESKSSLMKSVQLTNFKINQELFYSSNIQNTDERNANFNCLKKEKVSIFKSGQNARSQNVSPNSSFNDMLRSTEKEISTGGQKTTLEIADNNFFKKFKSLVLSREKQSEATAINKIIEQVRDKNVFNKSENEKASEIYSKDTGIPIAFTTSKFFIEENINDKNKITNQKCIKVKENLKLDLQKLSIQNNNKLLGILTSAQQARMSNNYLRHSLDKLIKIPQPLAYNIINKQTQERYSNQNKNITAESLEKTMKKLITSSQQGSLTERQIPRLSKNIYGIQNYNENNQLSQSYQISKNLVRQAYLDTRQHKSINSFQLNKISSNFQNSNQIN